MPKRLKNLVIKEVSSVDRGAGEGVKVLLMKRKSEDDDDAIVIDFGKMREAVGKQKGLDDAIGALRLAVNAIQKDDAITDKSAAVAKALSDFTDHVAKLAGDDQERTDDMDPKAIAKLIADEVAKAVKPLQDALTSSTANVAKLTLERDFNALPADQQAYCKAMSDEDKRKFLDKKPEERAADCKKAAEAAAGLAGDPVIKKLQADNEELQKRLAAADERDEVAKFAKQAKDLGLPEAHGEVMRKAFKGDPEAIKKHNELLKSLAECARVGKVFEEFGNNDARSGATPYDQLVAKATELRKTSDGAKLTQEQAFAKVYEDPANAEIVKQYKAAELARVTKAA